MTTATQIGKTTEIRNGRFGGQIMPNCVGPDVVDPQGYTAIFGVFSLESGAFDAQTSRSFASERGAIKWVSAQVARFAQ